MLKKKCSLFISIFCFLLITTVKAGFIEGEGRFNAKSGDTLAFVKKQLLANAFRDVISKELAAMGLDTNLFWNQFDIKFEKYFEVIKNKLKKRYKVEEENVKKEKIEAYNNALRFKRLSLKSDFGRLSRNILSYSIKEISRSTRFAKYRYLKLRAKIDRKRLNVTYNKFTSQLSTRKFKNLYLSVRFVLEDLSWSEMGVEVEGNFTGVVKDHWQKWLKKSLQPFLDNIILADETIVNKLEDFIRIPFHTDLNLFTSASEDKEANTDERGESKGENDNVLDVTSESLASNFPDSLWLQIKVLVKKEGEDNLLKIRKYSFDGEFVLIDLKYKNLIDHYDFLKESVKYSFIDQHRLSSNLASLVYRFPLKSFGDLKKNIFISPSGVRSVNLEIINLFSIQELLQVESILIERGRIHQFSPEIVSYSGSSAEVLLRFRGDGQSVINTLASINNAKINKTKMITFKSIERPFFIELKDYSDVLDSLDYEKNITRDKQKDSAKNAGQ